MVWRDQISPVLKDSNGHSLWMVISPENSQKPGFKVTSWRAGDFFGGHLFAIFATQVCFKVKYLQKWINWWKSTKEWYDIKAPSILVFVKDWTRLERLKTLFWVHQWVQLFGEEIFKFQIHKTLRDTSLESCFFCAPPKTNSQISYYVSGMTIPQCKELIGPWHIYPNESFCFAHLGHLNIFHFYDHIMTYDHIRWTVKTIILIITISGFIYVISCHACNIDEFSQNDHGVQACFPCANAGRPWCPGGSVHP